MAWPADARAELERATAETRVRAAVERAQPPLSPQDGGRIAELLVADLVGAAIWSCIGASLCRLIHGGGAVTAGDRGVDAVSPDGTLWQVKWYSDGTVVGSDAFARLNNIAATCRRGLGLVEEPHRVLAVRRGTAIAAGAVGRCFVEIREFDDFPGFTHLWPPMSAPSAMSAVPAAMTTMVADVPALEPCGSNESTAADATESPAAIKKALTLNAFEAFQAGVVDEVSGYVERGHTRVRIELPTGSGKSYVTEALAQKYTAGGPALVVTPRIEIIKQLKKLFTGRGWMVQVVCDGNPWPGTLPLGRCVLIASGQSLAKAPPAFRPSVVFVDEAHNYTGRDALERIESLLRFELSACLDVIPGIPVVRRSHDEAVDLGLICRARLVLAYYDHPPTLEDIAKHLAANAIRFSTVLACFKTCKRAERFVELCRAAGVCPAETFVGGDSSENLEGFREGRIRVLCVVGRVEMGVDIHRCDTILFAEPWDSDNKNLQLVGRGVRLHELKLDTFHVLRAIGPADVDASVCDDFVRLLQRLVPALHVSSLDDACRHISVERGGPARWGDAEPMALEAVRQCIFDSYGRVLEDSLFGLRARYAETRARLAAAGVRSSESYHAWAAALSEAEAPADPAALFAPLGPFVWAHFLGSAPDLDGEGFRTLLRAAAAELHAAGRFSVHMLEGAGAELYGRLRAAPSGAALPASPLMIEAGMSWADVFAALS